MLYTVRLQKGELWRPQDLKPGSAQVSVRVAKGVGWVTFESSDEDLIYRPGEIVDLNKDRAIVEALSEELDLEVQFMKKARSFFGKW
ncbi:hypothetical protein [Bdellovibrio sp. NC01]|uniref:hypothetical protein n=1 Tax=Bdellovibrio sp. NC01 TaxID=2220073 RepID=UPI00115971BD|nr:hypothetical protein [Bdellovibrio sp. NC01]QDK38432.1 hypothetical protein DOE51_13025 [Bdellovibrio sp. NC01]